MTQMIRDMSGLLDAVRLAKLERDISDVTLDYIMGTAPGTAAKYLGPRAAKGIGPTSLTLFLGALGKALVLVDDPEQIARVKSRWEVRTVRGGATRQNKHRALVLARGFSTMTEYREHMRKLGSKGGKMGGHKGGKRRLETMSARARQRVAAHAARKRWAKRNGKKSGATH